ncbi:MAG: hypothetical protein HND56_01565 [Pseudomonadota bacterium]|nr:hypothetical protein [Pseudomonadota bacterium]QKK04451.1 MAG: hypothetical protein HND56_01565 [Pseudomonadota bacterium]
MTTPSLPKPHNYTIKAIKEELASVALGMYGSMGPSLYEMERIENDIRHLPYDKAAEKNYSGYSEGLFECLWVLDKHREAFGENTPISLPRKLDDYLDDVYDHDYSVRPLADALKSFYDSELEVKRQEELAAAREKRNHQQNQQRNNLRQFIKKPPGPKR